MSEYLRVEITEKPQVIEEALHTAYDIGLTASSSWKLIVGLLQTAGYESHIAAATAYNIYNSANEFDSGNNTLIAEEHLSFSQEAIQFIVGERPANLETGTLVHTQPTIEENVYWSAVVYNHLSRAADSETFPNYNFDQESIRLFRKSYVSVPGVTYLLDQNAYTEYTSAEERLRLTFGVLLDLVTDIHTAQDDNNYQLPANILGQGAVEQFDLSPADVSFIQNNSYLPTEHLENRALLMEQKGMLGFNASRVIDAVRAVREQHIDKATEALGQTHDEAIKILDTFLPGDRQQGDLELLMSLENEAPEKWASIIEDTLWIMVDPDMIAELKTLFNIEE